MVLPSHCSWNGMAWGGWILKELDTTAFLVASRHCRSASPPVTVSIDSVDFIAPLYRSQVVTCYGSISRTFGSSMEVKVSLIGESPGQPHISNWPVLESYATFVNVDQNNKPSKVPQLILETPEQEEEHVMAGKRRENRIKATSPEFHISSHPGSRTNTYVEMTECIFRRHTNARGSAFGGQLMAWGELASAVSAARYTPHRMVLAASNQINFKQSVKLGDMISLRSQVTGVFNSSLEVGLEILKEDILSGEQTSCMTAYFTYVTLRDSAERRPVLEPFEPLTTQQQNWADAAKERKK